ncbi:hypothetical protein ACQCVH_09600 [Bacillus infantis]|uniref:hypothetical protein n=1 Tax=Bacillus infantis TaxID=324767 RepID=UPI003CF2A955
MTGLDSESRVSRKSPIHEREKNEYVMYPGKAPEYMIERKTHEPCIPEKHWIHDREKNACVMYLGKATEYMKERKTHESCIPEERLDT